MTAPTLAPQALTDRITKLVLADVAAGWLPPVREFSRMHDFVDANEYLMQARIALGLTANPPGPEPDYSWDQEAVELLDRWLVDADLPAGFTCAHCSEPIVLRQRGRWARIVDDLERLPDGRRYTHADACPHTPAVPPAAPAEPDDPDPLTLARRWVTPDVELLLLDELANEEAMRREALTKQRDEPPTTTLSTVIDSVAQGLPFTERVDVADLLKCLLVIRDLLPGDTDVRGLLA